MDIRKKGKNSVFGIFKNKLALEEAISKLKHQNFKNSDISVLMPTKEGTEKFAFEKNTKAPEGVATGATAGVVGGSILGWLVGAGALAIPGLGPFIAAGPIISAIAGAGVGGTVAGVAGGLIGLGIPEIEAKKYESYVKSGSILLSIHVDDSNWEKKAKSILEASGAENIGTTSEKKSEDSSYRGSNNNRESNINENRETHL
jgi:hypothetical protein